MPDIAKKIKQLEENIAETCAKNNIDRSRITLVVVTKSAGLEDIKKVIRLGYNHLGENRVQQLKKVSTEIAEFIEQKNGNGKMPEKINWHLIGHLQRNKVRQALPMSSLIHSVDTLRLAEEISAVAKKLDLTPKVLLQVDTSGELQKYGVPVGAAIHLAEQITTMPNIELTGLMTMAPLTRNTDVIDSCFARAQELFDEIKGEKIGGNSFSQLSMGMSSDYQLAIARGATILRVGSAIFAR